MLRSAARAALGLRQRVWAATRSQAKYRAYQEMAECFNDDATAMLSFKARAAI
ncbi:hypothetical protein PPUN15366_31840 [Pseudomonas putida]|nr:hypothetical protein PPUN15366_31840 [Pseudomonas putida]